MFVSFKGLGIFWTGCWLLGWLGRDEFEVEMKVRPFWGKGEVFEDGAVMILLEHGRVS